MVAMGPSARHADAAAMDQAIARLPEPVGVTAAVVVSVHRRPD
jgi:hypothetical protein